MTQSAQVPYEAERSGEALSDLRKRDFLAENATGLYERLGVGRRLPVVPAGHLGKISAKCAVFAGKRLDKAAVLYYNFIVLLR